MTGPALVVATVAAAFRAPRRIWIWHLCLVFGLALMAAGGLVIDDLPKSCGALGFFRFNGCLNTQFLEESLELMGGWLALVASLGWFSDAVSPAGSRLRLLLFIIPAFWILFLVLFSPTNQIEVSPPDQSISVQFDSGAHLYGYRMTNDGLPSSIIVRLPFGVNATEQGFSIDLLEQVGLESFSSRSYRFDTERMVWPKRYGFVPLYRQFANLELPSPSPTNRALWIVLSLWREGDGNFVRQEILSSNRQLLSDTQVILTELVIPAASAIPPASPAALFDNGFSLDTVKLPETARAGEHPEPHIHLAQRQPRI